MWVPANDIHARYIKKDGRTTDLELKLNKVQLRHRF